MRNGKIWMAIVPVLAALLLSQGAAAAEPKNASNAKPYYKKVSGEVVSLSQNSIVIKTRSKGPLTLAVTKNTDIAVQPKAGDRATVNYRVDKNGKTATRITPAAAGKPAQAPAQAPVKSAAK